MSKSSQAFLEQREWERELKRLYDEYDYRQFMKEQYPAHYENEKHSTKIKNQWKKKS